MKLLILSLFFFIAKMVMGRPSTDSRVSLRCHDFPKNPIPAVDNTHTSSEVPPAMTKMLAELDTDETTLGEHEDEGKDRGDYLEYPEPEYNECSNCCDCEYLCQDGERIMGRSLKRSRNSRSKSDMLAKREIKESDPDEDYCEECYCQFYCDCSDENEEEYW